MRRSLDYHTGGGTWAELAAAEVVGWSTEPLTTDADADVTVTDVLDAADTA